ncbi:hypothetical protein DSO57_1010559 [Entomophthora muscae]|uniref:Uncharacterized protein n=1 Tax=Entomophthora muscae TaxID=34485 RepID=A0ACC2SVJ9_9FUNG|nr:hypothetical protein DSO57_1010559 [Entomophthora muscae]
MDYNKNYQLNSELSYFPLNSAEHLVPNFVDNPVFLGIKKPLARATDKSVQEKIVQYEGPVVGDSKIKQGIKRNIYNPQWDSKNSKLIVKKPKETKLADIKHNRKLPVRLIKANKGTLDTQAYPLSALAPKKKPEFFQFTENSAAVLPTTSSHISMAVTPNSASQSSPGLQNYNMPTEALSEVAPQSIAHGKRKDSPVSDSDKESWISPRKKLK